jgi:hypothetical protein
MTKRCEKFCEEISDFMEETLSENLKTHYDLCEPYEAFLDMTRISEKLGRTPQEDPLIVGVAKIVRQFVEAEGSAGLDAME